MPSFNDLIGLEYKWGARPSDGSGFTDCFGLTMEIRKRLGLYDFYSDYCWMYEAHEDEGVSGKQILKWIWERGQRSKLARPGAIFRSPSALQGIALAAVINEEHSLMIGPSRKVIVVPFATVAKGKFYWAE
jgi:hypothetical protein